MPSWVSILIQVIQAILSGVIAHNPKMAEHPTMLKCQNFVQDLKNTDELP